MTTRTQGSQSLALGLTLTAASQLVRSANHPPKFPVDGCMFSNFIRTPLTCGSTSTNYASMPLNCTRTLSNCTRTLSNYMRTPPNCMCALSNCMQMLPNCKRVRSNCIAKNLNKTAQILAICRRNRPFPRGLA
jgi:hypothetical protein